MERSQVITNYESLSALTRQMRNAAMQGEWDTLTGLERQRDQHVTTIKQADAMATLDEFIR